VICVVPFAAFGMLEIAAAVRRKRAQALAQRRKSPLKSIR